MPKVPVKDLKCALKGCGIKATHLCESCKSVGYCCTGCGEKDRSYHSSLCKRLSKKKKEKAKTRTKSKSKKKKARSKSKSKSKRHTKRR